MKLAVLLYKDIQNPENIPGDWPAEVIEVSDDNAVINAPYVEMTVEQYHSYRDSKQSLYDAWEDHRELDTAKYEVIEKLWQSAYDYNFKYFSGGAFARILELKIAGSQKAIDTDAWIMQLWSDYFYRKAIAQQSTTLTQLNSISLDFTNNGEPPWTILEMLN
ncbi:hypothetical protein CCP1ISM_20056 [Azospirillaceae bacterium]